MRRKVIFQRQVVILCAAAAIAFFIFGFAAGFYFGKNTTSEIQNNFPTSQAETPKPSPQISEAPPAPMGQTQSVPGIVEKIDGSRIIIKTRTYNRAANLILEKQVLVQTDSRTKFYKYTEKDAAQYQKEMDEYNAKMRQSLPVRFVRHDAGLPDVKTGDLIIVQVFVSSPDDVANKQEFLASEVIITAPGQMMMP